VLDCYNRYRPDVLVAYTNPLYHFARALAEQGISPFAPKSIIVGAEKLYAFQRELIERVFRAPVFETYGTREFMLIGAECDRHRGFHLNMENLVVEILDKDGQPARAGEEGDVVITDLTNYGMPFIRYVNGDRAVAGWHECDCGRGLPLMNYVNGRRLDVLRTPDGRMVPGEFFPHLVKDYPRIRHFQVVQTDADSVEMRAVLNGRQDLEDIGTLVQEVRRTLGPEMRFELIPVEHIPMTGAGKHRVVVGLDCSRDGSTLEHVAG
jgi:phenylacetate-CoA ligase